MKTKPSLLLLALGVFLSLLPALAQQTTAFTYQGQLRDGGTNANGAYTMIFKLYDLASAGTQFGSTLTLSPTLANGLFTVNLDFGAGAFNGSARWLDITISNGGVTQTLSPRVQVLSTPYAQFAAVAATVTNGAILNAQLATNSVATANLQNGAITDAKLAAITTLAKGAENNLRIVRGILSSDSGTAVAGSGFTATFFPPGTGATNLPPLYGTNNGPWQVIDYSDTNSVHYYYLTHENDWSGYIKRNDWILVDGKIKQVKFLVTRVYLIDGIPIPPILGVATDIYLYDDLPCPVSGSVAVLLHPRLASEWDITFSPPFSSYPAIAVAAHGEDAFDSAVSQPVVNLKRSLSDGGTTFKAIIRRVLVEGKGFPDDCTPSGWGFEFIAVGPQ